MRCLLPALFLLACHSGQYSVPLNENLVISLLGDTLSPPQPSEALLEKFATHRSNYQEDPNADNLIWLGRFTAYQGKYQDAIDLYTRGIEQFPADARFYRHRGHRFISMRDFDRAISDLQKAVDLISGKPNQVEPDGMPNARNIPVSTLHGNIWYHLGLAHYLKQDFESDLVAYQNCRRSGNNPDNIVSSTHWLASILCRLGRTEEAQEYLKDIHPEMDVIENSSYHQLCLYYQGQLDEQDLIDLKDNSPSSHAALYGAANWNLCHGKVQEANAILDHILASDGWSSFGYIAAESERAKQRMYD